eukprot:m.353577 g.353577  ORF g.353577 m.353577 type:complete len:60 (+) comp65911_c0_seq1:117-296(+)
MYLKRRITTNTSYTFTLLTLPCLCPLAEVGAQSLLLGMGESLFTGDTLSCLLDGLELQS